MAEYSDFIFILMIPVGFAFTAWLALRAENKKK